MPPNILRVHTEYELVKSVGPKVLWSESRVRALENISLPFSSTFKLWRWRSVMSPSVVLSENFAELNRTDTCMGIKANADWNPGKHNVVSRTLLESPEVLLQGCGIDLENVRRRLGAGRPRATTSCYDRYIQLTARRNRTENATQLQRQLLLATGRKVSSQTARNRLHEGGLYARRPMVCIPLTPHHRAARRRWAVEHRDWEQHDWRQVLFTDESQFSR
ncbi:transposable element Tcb2 transposase [Trichonephila clavipes]|nr:transposable element Tcb2 transposase [Trichonephila clavipes]